MKKRIKAKPKSRRKIKTLAPGLMKTREVPRYRVRKERAPEADVFTPMETGRPDSERVPDIDNPEGAQGGLGPLNQEGEGEAQNDQLAALERIEPEK